MRNSIRQFSRRAFVGGLLNLYAVRAVAGSGAGIGGLRDFCLRSVRSSHALALGHRHLRDRGIAAVQARLVPRLAGIGDTSAAAAAIERLVREDFRTCRLVTVDGWVLSRTEAAIMAYRAWLRAAA